MKETTASFLKLEAIFHEVLLFEETNPGAGVGEARARLIDELCHGDPALITEIHALLRASDEESQATASHRTVPAPGPPPGMEERRQRPRGETLERKRIGAYQIDRLLGRGGMGAVYLAHRADGQFEQQVAIKLIDLPLATDLFRERFRQERQILAGLQHPFIARLVDGGVTPEGDLYLAMEYIDGVPIHRFCADHKLTQTQRLALFKNVCQAVQFAHQNLVVHRDLKPDNILVASDGTPRLLDFGTAKILSPSTENDGKDFTRQGFSSYTPQYASPEQVLGNPITTASDTYSLGVLLYLLLTETMPYALKEMSTAELVRVICEEPPRKPGNAAGSDKRLDLDLEAILMKALRKEPSERYLTVEQLTTDIQDYLDGHPVNARRGTFRYRAAKFIRRNRLALAGAGLLALTLSAGIAGVLWQARVANQQRRKADARSADLRQLSNSLLSELDDAIKQLPGSTGVQKLLVTRVLEHLDRMAADAQGDRATLLDLADAYSRLASLQGDPYYQNLGDPDGGLTSESKAVALIQPLVNANPNDLQALQSLATAQVTRSEILFGTGKTSDAVASMQAAVRAYDRLIAPSSAPVELIGEVAAVYGSLGDELGQSGTASLGDKAAALAAYRKTMELDHRALGIDPNFVRAKRGLAIIQMKIGSAELETDPTQSLKDFQSALTTLDALPDKEKSTLTMIRLRSMMQRKEANALEMTGRYGESYGLYDQVRRAQQDLADQDPQDLRALSDLQVILNDEAGTYDDEAGDTLAPPQRTEKERHTYLIHGRDLYAQCVSLFDRMLKRDPTNANWRVQQAYAEVKVGSMSQQLHEAGDGASLSRKGMATLKELAAKPDASVMVLDYAFDAALIVEPVELRDPPFALACAEREVALGHRQIPSGFLALARSSRAAGQVGKAHAAAKDGLALLPAPRPGEGKGRIQKLLEAELRP